MPLLYSLFILFLISLFDIGRGRSLRPPFYIMLAALGGVAFAAVKFFPMVDYLIRNPWIPKRAGTKHTGLCPAAYVFQFQSIHIFHTYQWRRLGMARDGVLLARSPWHWY